MDPPYVPVINPCGAYVHTFYYEKNATAPRAYLNFEGVDSCFYVWLNGSFVGYSQVSHSTSEFDVTAMIRDGENTLAVLVVKWCDGSYFEDQDKFRMSGIFRDVYLLTRPEEGICDYFLKALPSDDYKNGTIQIDFTYRHLSLPVEAVLKDADGTVLATKTATDTLTFDISNAHLWNAEDPYLYQLTLTCAGESIYEQVGIREIHATDGVLYINGTNKSSTQGVTSGIGPSSNVRNTALCFIGIRASQSTSRSVSGKSMQQMACSTSMVQKLNSTEQTDMTAILSLALRSASHSL